jgi:hypothetical protein
MLTLAPFPTCCICDQPVQLETSKADEHGQAVHGECYFLRVSSKPRDSKGLPTITS